MILSADLLADREALLRTLAETDALLASLPPSATLDVDRALDLRNQAEDMLRRLAEVETGLPQDAQSIHARRLVAAAEARRKAWRETYVPEAEDAS